MDSIKIIVSPDVAGLEKAFENWIFKAEEIYEGFKVVDIEFSTDSEFFNVLIHYQWRSK